MIASQIATCVATLHANGVAHGDIKPRNIVRLGNQYKLVDLDMAVCFHGNHSNKWPLAQLVDVAKSTGSSAYVAPEIYRWMRGTDACTDTGDMVAMETDTNICSRGSDAHSAADMMAPGCSADAMEMQASAVEYIHAMHPRQMDIWAFGATVFELYAG